MPLPVFTQINILNASGNTDWLQSHLGQTDFMLECISSIFSGSPPHRHTNPALSPLIATETSDTEITTTEIIKRRDVGPYGIRSEYCIRKIICPLGVPETPKGNIHFFIPVAKERKKQKM